MDLRQLRALVAVADHASFSAAARSLHTVQSNVSTHIARLERELGVILVERSTGKLTVEGEAVVERARRIEAELQAIDADLASNAGEVRGILLDADRAAAGQVAPAQGLMLWDVGYA